MSVFFYHHTYIQSLESPRTAIDSALAQTFTDFELIVVNDGSTDNTVVNFDKTYNGNSKVRLITQSNQERGAARNNGLKNAAGKYAFFLDSDDIMFKNHLETLYNKIRELKEPDFLTTKYQFIRNGKITFPDVCKIKEGYYDYKLFLNGNPIGANVCVRVANKDLHPFESDRKYSITEDWMFHVQNYRKNKLYVLIKLQSRCMIMMNVQCARIILLLFNVPNLPENGYINMFHSLSTTKNTRCICKLFCCHPFLCGWKKRMKHWGTF